MNQTLRSQSTRLGRERTRALVSFLLAASTYYSARIMGASQLEALTALVVVSVWRVAYCALHDRKVDGMAALLVIMNTASITVGICTRSAQLMLLSNQLPAAAVCAVAFASLAIRKPLTGLVASWVHGSPMHTIIGNESQPERATAASRNDATRTWVLASVVLIHLVVAVTTILTQPVDIALGVSAVSTMAANLLIVTILAVPAGYHTEPQAGSRSDLIPGRTFDNIDKHELGTLNPTNGENGFAPVDAAQEDGDAPPP